MTRIYTRKGDDGTTSLWYGGRVAKNDARTEAYGSIDEAGAALGAARSLCGADDGELAADILRLQRELFVAGAELATAPEAEGRLQEGISRIDDGMVEALEPVIDRYMDRVDLPPKFVITGGTTLSAQLDVARTVIRRAERRVVALRDGGELASDAVLRYLNRASDLAFAMARFADVPDPELFQGRDANAADG
ncbi:MAG TPA: cob(I)yrinic acid a,c-diamide adenosyltransferase [Solirubrobacterales bacterium]|nr:cob(I)yrinic acid a,c-diamide adenosyltransferase [Solirubrobacterales bacterium]